MLGLAATERPCAFEQSSEGCHGISVERDGSMARGGLAAADRRDPAEEIHVLPAQVLDLDAATSGRNGEHCRAMRDQPFRTARGGLKQLALQIGRQNLRYCAAILWEGLYVFRDGIPDLGSFSMRRRTPVSMLTVRPEMPASNRAF